MGATSFLDTVNVHAEPGEETVCELQIRNSGEIVDQFALDVVGDVQGWTAVEPRLINLLPGDEARARVIFTPPRSPDVLAGVFPFGVRIRSREDPHASLVEEGEVEVAPFTEVAAEVVPATRRGRRRAKYRLVVDNFGNQPTDVEITAIEEANTLTVDLDHTSVRTRPGTATLVRTRAVPHKRFLRGQPVTHPFQLLVAPVVEGEQAEELTADAVMIQEALLPKWALKAALIAVAAVVGLIALWFMLLKPTVESVAREQAKEEVANAGNAAEKANKAASAANEAAAQANEAAGGGAGSNDEAGANGNGSAGSGRGADATGGDAQASVPVSFRIQAQAPAVSDGTFTKFNYVAPDHQALDIGDVVLQNPRADAGFLRISIGDDVVLELGLTNFRDLDYHYVVPLHADPDQPVVLSVNCVAPGSNAPTCTPSVSFSGRLSKPPAGQ